jgi:hypothetical protein
MNSEIIRDIFLQSLRPGYVPYHERGIQHVATIDIGMELAAGSPVYNVGTLRQNPGKQNVNYVFAYELRNNCANVLQSALLTAHLGGPVGPTSQPLCDHGLSEWNLRQDPGI